MRWIAICIAGLLAGCTAAVKPPPEADLPPVVATYDCFTLRASDTNVLARALRYLPALRTKVKDATGIWLTNRLTMAIFDTTASWQKFLAIHNFKADGRGLLYENLIAVEMKPSDIAPEYLAHEMVHAAMHQSCRAPLPLWFDEGLASYLGWRIARDTVWNLDHRTLVRTLPAIPRNRILVIDNLFKRANYPQSPAANQAFFRECEELVRLLDERFGDAGLRHIAAKMVAGESLRDCLKWDYEYSMQDWDRLDDALYSRCVYYQEW